jgi:hypothetical protein
MHKEGIKNTLTCKNLNKHYHKKCDEAKVYQQDWNKRVEESSSKGIANMQQLESKLKTLHAKIMHCITGRVDFSKQCVSRRYRDSGHNNAIKYWNAQGDKTAHDMYKLSKGTRREYFMNDVVYTDLNEFLRHLIGSDETNEPKPKYFIDFINDKRGQQSTADDFPRVIQRESFPSSHVIFKSTISSNSLFDSSSPSADSSSTASKRLSKSSYWSGWSDNEYSE